MASSAPSRVADRLWVRRLQQRAGALAVVSALVCASVPTVALAAPSQEEIGRMYGEGQDYMEQKEFKRAAEVFTRLLNLVEESGDNKAIRESLILNILDAHIQAYEGIVDENGRGDVEQLKQGKATLQQYYKDFQAVHGDAVAVLGDIQTLAAKLDRLLEEDEPAPEAVPPVVPPGEEVTPPPVTNPPPTTAPPSNAGLGLIIGGAALGVAGVGAAVMIAFGSSSGRNAEEDYNDAQEDKLAAQQMDPPNAVLESIADDKIDAANEAGQRANAVLITGAVLTPLLLGGAAALIIIGVKKRRQSTTASIRPRETLTAAPSFGRRFTGFSLQGRF